MAIPVARVHLAMAHAALPALLPTPPRWKMLPLLSTPCVAAILSKLQPATAKPGRADADERWDARKTTKPASAQPSASSSSSSAGHRSADSVIRSSAGGHGSSPHKNAASSPPPKLPGRADSVERWDAHKKAARLGSSSSSSSSGTSSLASSSKWPISRVTSAERWDMHKERRPPQADQRLDDGESSSSTGSGGDIDTEEEEEEILWKPRAMYAGPGSRRNPAFFPCQQRSWFPLHSCAPAPHGARTHHGLRLLVS